MSTITIRPIHGALDHLPDDFKQKWFDALQTSNKHQDEMCYLSDEAHCCLCVGARLEGAAFEDYRLDGEADSEYAPLTATCNVNMVALIDGKEFNLPDLNDSSAYDISHCDIAEIIMGRSVTVEGGK